MSEQMHLNVDATHDTSHYDACRTMLSKQKNHHLIQSFFLTLLCVINGYIHIIPMPMRRTTGDYPIFVRNGIWDIGFAYGLLALVVTVVIIVLSFLGTQEKPKLKYIVCGLLVLCIVLDLMLLWIAIPCMLICFWSIYESKRAAWIKQQPGYPYFNERFADQLTRHGKQYHSRYDLKQKIDGIMTELDAEKEHDTFTMEPAQKREYDGIAGADIPFAQAQTDRPSVLMNVEAPVVSAISDLSELAPAEALQAAPEEPKVVPIAVPELSQAVPELSQAAPEVPKAAPPKRSIPKPEPEIEVPSGNDIPDPVWDVPDPVMDTGSILSDFPEVNGDIPDLPEVPDIPQL